MSEPLVYSDLVRTDELTCAVCPTQYEGELVNGRRFYFRYRYGRAMLGIGDTIGAAVDDTMPPTAVLAIGDRLDGDLDRDEYEQVFVRLYAMRVWGDPC